MAAGETLLRVGNVESENGIEIVRDALDQLGIEYEYVRSEPDDSYPTTVYFYVAEESVSDVDHLLGTLSEEHGYDVEIL